MMLLNAPENVTVDTKSIGRNKVEIINPLPLLDLQHMIHLANEGYDSEFAKSFDKLGKGHFGTVFGYKDFAIKIQRHGSGYINEYKSYNFKVNGLRDAELLKALQEIPEIPRIYAVIDDSVIIMERVNGMTVRDYREKNEETNYSDNYISEDYCDVLENAINHLMDLGFNMVDLHWENAMICRNTGLPKIIDVGLFDKMRDGEYEAWLKDRNIYNNSYCRDALHYLYFPMKKFIERKLNPQKFVEMDNKLAELRAERKRKEEEREARREAERAKIRKELKEREQYYEGKRNNRAIISGGIKFFAGDVVARPVRANFNAFHQGVRMASFNLAPIPRAVDIDFAQFRGFDSIHKKQKPSNMKEIIENKKKNHFNDGVRKLVGGNNKFIQNVHKNKFAMGM